MKLCLFLFFIPFYCFGKYSHQELVSNLGIVWAMESFEDNIIFTEKSGKLKIYNLTSKKLKTISGTPEVETRGQGGLLDITLHPDFKKNKRVYLSYSKSLKNGNKTTALGYGILNGTELISFKDIFVAKGKSSKRYHYGSRVVFDENNNLYLSIGERGQRESAQDLNSHFGSIVHLGEEGNALKENPFFKTKDKLSEIWSYGHRNPQGLFYDMETKTLFDIEHGPRGGDEINIIKKGANYGWPIVSHGKEYMLPMYVGDYREKYKNMIDSIKYYVPSIAPCDLTMYQGDKYPELKGYLITGALKLTHLHFYNPKTKKELRLFETDNIRVRSILIKDGDIYFGADDGKIRKLIRKKS